MSYFLLPPAFVVFGRRLREWWTLRRSVKATYRRLAKLEERVRALEALETGRCQRCAARGEIRQHLAKRDEIPRANHHQLERVTP